MTAIDLVLLAIVAVSTVFGAFRGLIGVLASLAAWILAGWGAFRFGAEVARMLEPDGVPGTAQLFGGYALAFIGVLLVVGIAGWLLRKLVHGIGLSAMDRFLGLLLGLARGVLIACVLVLLLGLSELPREPAWQQSRLLPVFLPGASWLAGLLPGWVAAELDLRGERSGPALIAPLPAPEGA
ncbi:CvpA family protein [Lysobacter sp. GX 14042]|uniref:CvpA family protein n=1 Tax=Lysobacter sp. GX 14042 TaxID=2907155 RepID=UPI001F491DF4|nr:CvpA family protein [Lysobacter sp. GX 14042]MCE7033262.1 CvpA family protein [Lysobacter sp. GX 14042]